MSDGWLKCDSDIPSAFKSGGYFIKYNDNELIATSYKTNSIKQMNDNEGIYIFNILKKEWRLLLKYPKSMQQMDNISPYYDKSSNLLCILYTTGGWMNERVNALSINMQNTEYSISKIVQGHDKPKSGNIVANGKDIHIIGGYLCNTHYLYNLQTKSLKLIHSFEQYKSMHGISLVHIKSHNVILLIGGTDDGPINCHRFCLKTQNWKRKLIM